MGGISNVMKKMVGLKSGRLTKTWDYQSNATVLVPPTVADINGDGKPEIVFGTSKGDLIVLDWQAKELWRYSIHEQVDAVEEMFLDQDVMNSINSPPALADLTGDGRPNIIFGSEMGVLYCLDETGKLIWKYKTDGGIRGSPLIADVNNDGQLEVVFGTTTQFIYFLSKEGKLIERFEQSAPIESTPGYHEGQVIFGTNDGKIISLSAKGQENWTYQTKGKITAAPAFGKLEGTEQDFVVIGSTDNYIYCLDIEGELVWTYETQGAIYSQAALADLNKDKKLEILFGSCDNNVYALTADGDKYWSYETDFWVYSTPLIADIDGDGNPEVIIGSYDHNIYILDSRGSYMLDYVPGLSGVVQQPGHYSEIMTQEPGQHVGKKIWQFKTDGIIVGCAKIEGGKEIVVTTKTGVLNGVIHKQ